MTEQNLEGWVEFKAAWRRAIRNWRLLRAMKHLDRAADLFEKTGDTAQQLKALRLAVEAGFLE